ncbi:MAG: peptidase inhibitor family I36 protein [Acidobacteriota bacterium]|nr:peptidase inhibitor family I36 protein [Acidobacteriota bacterium]
MGSFVSLGGCLIITLRLHANFLGNSAHLTADVADLRDFRGPCVHNDGETSSRTWNDCVSSVRVAPGWRATLYRGTNYRDDSLELTEDMSNLQLVPQHDCPERGLNDCVSSVRVRQQ